MTALLAEPGRMAKKMGRPKGERDDVPVKLDRKLASRAKAIATARGISIGQYLSELTKDAIAKDYGKLLRETDPGK